MSLLAELKRRRIYRVAAAYLAVAIPIIAFVDLTYDSLPYLSAAQQEWTKDVVIYVLAAGFPVSLALGWLFDWTPEGIVRDRGAPEESNGASGAAATGSESGRRVAIRELIAAGPASTSRLLRIAVRISGALAERHSCGSVHGSLNPDAILIAPDDDVELTGFGAGGVKTASEASDLSAYLAPECVRGDRADYRSDQFSFGAVLYELATGRRAFVGANRDETLAAVLSSDPEPANRFNSEIPMPLQWAIERCLAKRPEDRYEDTSELKAELAAIADSVISAVSVRFAPKQNLPAPRTPLIGREAEIEAIKDLALDGANWLISLTGAGGIGKTRLLIELGRDSLEDFAGGVYFVPLDRVQDADLVTSEIAKAMNVQQTGDLGLDEALQNHVRQYCVAPTLLLIDNFEHVIEAAPRLSDLLEASEWLQIFVTSRAALRVYGEHEYRLPPLSIDRSASVEDLAESPAVRLFLERASALPKKLDEESLRIVGEICSRLDGLPLAIELAAPRTKVLPLPTLLERIQDPLRLLSSGPRDLPARQQTLRATLEWSYELLDASQQKLFRRVGVFVGGATLESIEAICNVDEDLDLDLVQAVESLVDNSLLRPMEADRAEPRFTMPETMREYALEQLVGSGEEVRTRRAHAAYFLVLASESTQAQAAGNWDALYDRFDRESGNLRAALGWLIETGDGDWGLKLANGLCHYWLQRAQSQEGFERMQELIALVDEDSDLLLWALCWSGDFAANMGRLEEADDLHSRSFEQAKKRKHITGILRTLNALAVNTQQKGEMEKSIGYHEEAVAMARKLDAPPSILGGMLSNYADNAMRRGDLDQAQRLHEETLQLFTDMGNEPAIAWALNRLGDVARQRGDYRTARKHYEESMTKFRALADKSGMAGCLYDFAALCFYTGDIAEAEELNSEALSLYRGLNQIADYPRVLEALSRCSLESGRPKRALTLVGSAAAMRQTLSLAIPDSVQEQLNEHTESARKALTDSEATASWMAGWAMSPDQAVAFALGEEESPAPAR